MEIITSVISWRRRRRKKLDKFSRIEELFLLQTNLRATVGSTIIITFKFKYQWRYLFLVIRLGNSGQAVEVADHLKPLFLSYHFHCACKSSYVGKVQ